MKKAPTTKWIELGIPGGDIAAELLADELLRLGASGLVNDGPALRVFFPEETWTDSTREQLEKTRQSLIEESLLPAGEILAEPVENVNWVGRWRRSLGPTRAGKHFVVVPPGVEYSPKVDDLILSIEPRMAFGTGEHATTRMALELLEPVVRKTDRVLDVGCGNGILSIAALMLGANSIVGIDVEPESVEESNINIDRHGFSGRAEIIHGDGLKPDVRGRFHLILANILFRPIKAGLKNWTELAGDESRIILTGIRVEDESQLAVQLAESMGWTLEAELNESGWYAARFFRGSA